MAAQHAQNRVSAGGCAAELNRSVYVYGLPDFTGYRMSSPAEQTRLLRVGLELRSSCLSPGWPTSKSSRLKPAGHVSRTLRLRIEGLLLIDPAPEHVTFDTVLELTSGNTRCRMRDELLLYYERELTCLRQMGALFAEKYPKVASRLLLEPGKCEDPHVERLLEAFAFLAARVHLKVDDEFPGDHAGAARASYIRTSSGRYPRCRSWSSRWTSSRAS